ncbi:beta-lactamase-like protein [Crepidotus variabilis]|uniref:Beta-lactamase-like protein n=1 Tax=Crepidotus variabilis TaxID=179855 RepID=A0A9P6ER03_9AGAR|nr:beta-lactamase-like protein [Crepidotus variabilis]
MPSNMSVTFLGTSSGGGPTESRNCSSLVCDMASDSLWMVDCAEGTTRQFALQPHSLQPRLSIQKVNKIFITHMHADHLMGVVPFLRNLLFPPPTGETTVYYTKRTVDLYGPPGLRLFVRQNMKMTITRTSDTYRVHELLNTGDVLTPCNSVPKDDMAQMDASQPNVMHYSELAGSDIHPDEDGLWRNITAHQGQSSGVVADAGPILHRDPCFGYVFTETQYPTRKIVVLGDTYDPSAIIPLCSNPSPSLLVHEATDSHVSEHADPSGKLSRRTPVEVQQKALARGHSVPEMAGDFAKKIGAKMLILNHISPRFPATRHPKDFARQNIINDIEKNANEAWGFGKRCKAAYDYLRVKIPVQFEDQTQDGTATDMQAAQPTTTSLSGAPVDVSGAHASAGNSSGHQHPQRGRGRGSHWRGGSSRDIEMLDTPRYRGGYSGSRGQWRGRGRGRVATEDARGMSDSDNTRGGGKRQRTF